MRSGLADVKRRKEKEGPKVRECTRPVRKKGNRIQAPLKIKKEGSESRKQKTIGKRAVFGRRRVREATDGEFRLREGTFFLSVLHHGIALLQLSLRCVQVDVVRSRQFCFKIKQQLPKLVPVGLVAGAGNLVVGALASLHV